MKSSLQLRPFYHRTEARVRAHVLICYLAFLIERYVDRDLKINKADFSSTTAFESLSQRGAATMEIDGRRYTYVILVIAFDDPTSIVKGLGVGAVDYITKPIEPTVLKARVKNFLRYHRGYQGLRDPFDTMMENAKLKEEVAHIVRHDMKSPLSAIISLASQMGASNPPLR